jgi:hypothetical protein
MPSLRVTVFGNGVSKGSATVHGDKTITVGTSRGTPDLTIDDERLPPIFPVAQFVGGKLWAIHRFAWTLEQGPDGVMKLDPKENGVTLLEAEGGKLSLVFQSQRDGEARLDLEVV